MSHGQDVRAPQAIRAGVSTKPKAATTARMISEPTHSAWERDQLDPDNWLRIPEFGVAPADVGFEGFAFPIVTPRTREEPFATAMREMVRTVRKLARAEFQTLEELRAIGLGAIDALWPAAAADDVPRKDEAQNLTVKQIAALRYNNAMMSFELADRQWHDALREPADEWSIATGRRLAESFAVGASMVVGWLTGRPFERDLRAVERMRRGASAGGKASGKTRRAHSGLPTPAVLRREREKLIALGRARRDVAAILAARHGCSASHIRKTLKRA